MTDQDYTAYQDYAEAIRGKLNFKSATEKYGISYRNGRATCPFHGGKNDFSAQRDYGKCFSGKCGWSGDLTKFVEDYFNLSFTEAVSKINADFSLGLPIGRELTHNDIERMQKAQEQRERDALIRKQTEEARLNRFGEIHKKWAEIERILSKPIKSEADLTDDVVWALKNRDYYSYLMDCIEGGDTDNA